MKRGLRQKPLSHLNCFIKKKESFGFDELLVKHRNQMCLACCWLPQRLPWGQPSPTLLGPPTGIPVAGRGSGSPRDGVSWGVTSCQTLGTAGALGGHGLAWTQAALAFSM